MQADKMLIRRAENKDIDGINKLLYQVLMVHHNGRPDLFQAGGKKYRDEQLTAIIADDTKPIFVCVDEGNTVLGYAFCIYQQHINNSILTDIKTLYIDDLCVDETLRGKHIGKELYDSAVELAKDTGCYNLTLNVWSCNQSALRFYESLGLLPQKIGMELMLK